MLSNLKVLLVNDDGVDAVGIKYLAEKLYGKVKEIMVVAPLEENSAISHAMTIKKGLRLEQKPSLIGNIKTYGFGGTPADCVKFAISHLNYQPDLVISGINNGTNIGSVIVYSGTLAAASEGAYYGVKSIALSVDPHTFNQDYNVIECLEYIYNNEKLRNSILLNVNIPVNSIGYMVTSQGDNPFDTSYIKGEDGLYYVQGSAQGEFIKNSPNSDVLAHKNKYTSITPLLLDRTDYSKIV